MLSVVYFFIDIFVVNIEPIHGQNDIAGFQYTCRGCPLVSGVHMYHVKSLEKYSSCLCAVYIHYNFACNIRTPAICEHF